MLFATTDNDHYAVGQFYKKKKKKNRSKKKVRQFAPNRYDSVYFMSEKHYSFLVKTSI